MPRASLTLPLGLLLASTASACGIAPNAQNASCCECAGYDGDAHACHWCPPPVGGCRYSGSADYRCPGFVAERADCPTACPPIGPTGTVTSTPSPTPSPASLSRTPSPRSATPSPGPPPPLRPFSKKGVGYFGGQCGDFDAGGLSNISWFYDWGHDQASLERSGCASSGSNHNMHGVEYVPQIWGKYALKNITNMNTTYIQGAKSIFSFNEPDHSGSSWLPPAEGAARWPDMVALAQAFSLTLVAPCVSNYAGGAWWMQVWNEGCRNATGANCTFDHTCLHTYFEPADVSSLFSSLERMHADYGRPIWLNEFACPPYKNCSAADQLVFAKDVVPRLEALPYVYRYAWFEARHGDGAESLLANVSGVELTPLGEYYNGVQPAGGLDTEKH